MLFFNKNYILLIGYSDMSLEYGTYGRLYANHYENSYTKSEVCATGFNRNGVESLCQSQGNVLDTYTTYAN